MKYPAHVYAIYFNGKAYIGISHNPEKRFVAHQSHLRTGTHPVEDFQADYDASKSKKLFFLRLEDVESETERWKEHKWQYKFNSYDRHYGYNYKDPTARTVTERYERKARCKTALKDRIRKAFVLVAKEPPRTRKQAWEEHLRATQHLSDEEFVALYLYTNTKGAPHEQPHHPSASPDAHPRGRGEANGADQDRRREFIKSINT